MSNFVFLTFREKNHFWTSTKFPLTIFFFSKIDIYDNLWFQNELLNDVRATFSIVSSLKVMVTAVTATSVFLLFRLILPALLLFKWKRRTEEKNNFASWIWNEHSSSPHNFVSRVCINSNDIFKKGKKCSAVLSLNLSSLPPFTHPFPHCLLF